MKTSNIILLIIIASISLIILLGAIDMRVNGGNATRGYSSTVVTPFKYLILKETTNVTVKASDEFEIAIETGHDELNPQVSFHADGDTLVMDYARLAPDHRTVSVFIGVPPEHLEWIKAKNASFQLADFSTGALIIHLDNSQLNIIGKRQTKSGSVKITCINDSEINTFDGAMDTLYLQMDNSRARLRSRVNKLKGSMANRSSLLAREMMQIEFQRDSTSFIQ
jgi:hypothetical protein